MNSTNRTTATPPTPQLTPGPPRPDASMHVRTASAEEHDWFDQKLADQHYLGAGRSVGDYLRQIVEVRGAPVALLVWGPACYALKDRDRWIGWSANHRVERLKLIVQNRRFLVLSAKGTAPNLASQTMGAALRVLPAQWAERFGYRPLLAESFTDPEAYEGTCYKASNWQPVGTSAGYSRQRADFYVPNDRPKKLWLYAFTARSRDQLKAVVLPADCQAGGIAPPSGVLPVTQPQMISLLELLRQAPDPRAKNTRLRIGPVLAIVAMALLAGRRDIAEIARFAQTLRQAQRRELGLPKKSGTQAFWQVPTYSVFYQVLTRLDSEAFAALLDPWLRAAAGSLPASLALDGKMIRDRIGLLTLAQHEDGAPYAVAVYDQKEGTPRCEQTVATALLKKMPALDGQTITADPLHCQKINAAVIVEKGGEFLFQIKGNQPSLLAQGEACAALKDTPFFSHSTMATGAPNTAACTPSRSSPRPPASPEPAASS